MIYNKGKREEKERERERQPKREIMYYYSTVTSKKSNLAIFANIYFLHICYIKPKYNTML